MGCIIKTTITNWKQLNPSSFMPVGLTICHSPTDKSLLSGVEPGNYQNGQNYRIMELSGAGGRASGKAICSSSRQLFFCLFSNKDQTSFSKFFESFGQIEIIGR